MPRRLSPLNALKSFEAAARQESFTRAAEELFVTQAAVSQQVKALEVELGFKLFNHERQRLKITESGRDYLMVIREALDRIAAGTERLMQRQSAGTITVSTSPDFAAKWLVRRLARFSEAHPGIDLRVLATMRHVDFARDDVDLAVRHGDGNWAGLDVTRLCPEQLFAICSPKLLTGRNRLKAPMDVLKWPLLRLDENNAWERWFGLAGVAAPETLQGPVLNRASMVIDAAIDGQGIALARTTLAASIGALSDLSMCHGSPRRLIGSFAQRRPRRLPRSVGSAIGWWRRRPTIPACYPSVRAFTMRNGL